MQAELRRQHGRPPGTLYRHELGLCLGETRVDVAAVNGSLTGVEIKGDRDKLTRLPRQVELYGRVLDHAIIAAAGRHAEKITDHVPDWWGVWRVDDVRGRALVTRVRDSAVNPSVDPLSVAQLLWRDEAYQLLAERDAVRGLAKATRWVLWDKLVETLTLQELSLEVRNRLRARQEW